MRSRPTTLPRTLAVVLAVTALACGRVGFEGNVEGGASDGAVDDGASLDGGTRPHVATSSVAAFDTTSPAFVDVPGGLSFVAAAPSEQWVLFFSAHLGGSNDSTPDTELRYFVNGIERGIGQSNAMDGTWSPWVHFDFLTGVVGEVQVTMQARAVETFPARIADLRVVALRLPSGADAQFSELTAPVMPVGTFAEAHRLDVVPAASDSYLLMALVVGTEEPSAGVLKVRLRDPLGAYWPERPFTNDRRAYQSMFLARIVPLGGATASFAIELSGNATLPSTARDIRMLAFRTGVLAGLYSTSTLPTHTTDSPTPVVSAELNVPAPPEPRWHLSIQSFAVTQSVTGLADRAVSFGHPAGEITFTQRIDNDQQCPTFGRFELVRAEAAATYRNAYFTPSPTTSLLAQESVIHVLDVGP